MRVRVFAPAAFSPPPVRAYVLRIQWPDGTINRVPALGMAEVFHYLRWASTRMTAARLTTLEDTSVG